MTTQDHPTTESKSPRRYQVFWNDNGEYVSNLEYTDDQIEDINEIVFAVVRGLLDENRFDISVTYESGNSTEGGNS